MGYLDRFFNGLSGVDQKRAVVATFPDDLSHGTVRKSEFLGQNVAYFCENLCITAQI